MSKKGGTPIAVLLLTIGVVVIMLYTWTIFDSKQEIEKAQLQVFDILDKTYSQESKINLHVQEIMKSSVKNLDASSSFTKTQFLESFKEQLDIYSLEAPIPELETIPPQLDESSVSINKNQITLALKFKISRIAKIENREVVHVEYIYEKNFTEEMNVN